MFSEGEYINGWLAYSAGVIVGLWCWWYLVYKLPLKYLRPALFGAMAGLLMMPFPTAEGSHFLAPAWIIAGAEGVFEGGEAFWRAGTPMLIAIAVGVVAAIVMQGIALLIKGGGQHNNTQPQQSAKMKEAKVKAASVKAKALKARQA